MIRATIKWQTAHDVNEEKSQSGFYSVVTVYQDKDIDEVTSMWRVSLLESFKQGFMAIKAEGKVFFVPTRNFCQVIIEDISPANMDV